MKTSAELRTEDLAALKDIAEIELTSVTRLIQKAVRIWIDNYRSTQAANKIHSAIPATPIDRTIRIENGPLKTDTPDEPEWAVCDYCAVRGCEGECRIKKGDQK